MNIVVCLKQTLDPEVPAKHFKIDPATKKPVQGNANLVMDSYAENALEAGIQLKEKLGGKVTALCLGTNSAEEVLRRSLALTADEAVRVWDDGWNDLDAHAVAHVLAKTIQHLGGADLVLFGRQSADAERGMVGSMVAEELGVSCTTLVAKVQEVSASSIRLQREVEGGFEVVEGAVPAVLTVTSHASNLPRLPKVKDTMMAMRKKLTVLGAGDVGVDGGKLAPRVELKELYVPVSEGECEIVEGDEPTDKASALVRRLRERKVL